MSRNQAIERLIKLTRPHAKYIAVTHSSVFTEKEADLGDGYFHVGLDDENINSNLIHHKNHGLIMIHNYYLSSFSYNLILCWLIHGKSFSNKTDDLILTGLLKYNLKKFFAEQLLLFNNNVFSRAIFLETLLYEQFQMIPVIAEKSENPKLNKTAESGANLALSILSMHELGHFKFRTPLLWEQLLELKSDLLQALNKKVTEKYSTEFIEEFRCDVFAVICCFDQFKAEMGETYCLRAIVFAYATYAVMSSLTKSAQKTGHEQKSVVESIDFNSVDQKHEIFTYAMGPDIDFTERVQLVIELCQNIANIEKIDLFGNDGEFPLPDKILDYLMHYLDIVMENTDLNARNLARLVAESYHGNKEGFEYLKLRSKKTRFGDGRNIDGTVKQA